MEGRGYRQHVGWRTDMLCLWEIMIWGIMNTRAYCNHLPTFDPLVRVVSIFRVGLYDSLHHFESVLGFHHI